MLLSTRMYIMRETEECQSYDRHYSETEQTTVVTCINKDKYPKITLDEVSKLESFPLWKMAPTRHFPFLILKIIPKQKNKQKNQLPIMVKSGCSLKLQTTRKAGRASKSCADEVCAEVWGRGHHSAELGGGWQSLCLKGEGHTLRVKACIAREC